MDIRFERVFSPKAMPKTEDLHFGRHFSDHMFIMNYDTENGWYDARIVPFANISMHPAATVLHYGAEIFEGLKAYYGVDGNIRLFRPIENIRRLNRSAERLCLPQIDEDFAMEALMKFVEIEKNWVPKDPGTSLYLRPFMFGVDPHLGVHAPNRVIFMIIASPVRAYFKEGFKPVQIIIEDQDVRAVRGGTGYAKCGGNYAASMRAGKKAEDKGYSQVLWLDGVERKYIEEVGAMNVMFKINGEIVTPALTGSILPGITRMSSIELLRSWGHEVNERQLSLKELARAMEEGTLEEAWGTGTAAVISPIGHLEYSAGRYAVNGGNIGPVTQKLYDTMTGIQYGSEKDPFGWSVVVCKA